MPNKRRTPGPQVRNFSSKFDSAVDSLVGESEFMAFYITEANANSCPRIDFAFGDEVIGSVVDKGTDVSVI
jgi:hypothetical protein